jgi:hypothetical protein
MVYELCKRGLAVAAEQPIPLRHEGVQIDVAYRADLIVEDKVTGLWQVPTPSAGVEALAGNMADD